MNNYNLTLESSSSSLSAILDETVLQDHTTLSLDVSGIFDKIIPLYLKIDWGDGSSEIHDNDIYVIDRKDVNALSYSPIFSKVYKHEYYPSENSLYKSLSAQILIGYSDGGYNWTVIPIKIRTYDYFESIYDLELQNIAIIPTYPEKIEYSLVEKKNNYLLQLQ